MENFMVKKEDLINKIQITNFSEAKFFENPSDQAKEFELKKDVYSLGELIINICNNNSM